VRAASSWRARGFRFIQLLHSTKRPGKSAAVEKAGRAIEVPESGQAKSGEQDNQQQVHQQRVKQGYSVPPANPGPHWPNEARNQFIFLIFS